MAFTKEEADKVLSGLGMATTARRGGNLQVSFESLGAFKHVIDENTGEELMSRDEAISRHQLKVVDTLREAGLPARISNVRRQDISGQEVFTFSPSIWVNNTQNANVGASRAVTAKLAKTEAMLEAVLAALPKEIREQLAAATPPAQTAGQVSEEIPL